MIVANWLSKLCSAGGTAVTPATAAIVKVGVATIGALLVVNYAAGIVQVMVSVSVVS